ncbi:MAG: FtsQ-type POTRA domain-containing protein, partial [Clostridiales bacterium]|nr:FtsQ-type POTRA domain-containing protein [Clostridiales bacterium]
MAVKGKVAHLDNYRNKRRRRRTLRKSRVFGIFLLIAVLCAVYFISRSSLFDLKRIAVEGNLIVSAEKIIELSGIELGENIFAVSAARAEQLLRAEPAFYAAEVIKKY